MAQNLGQKLLNDQEINDQISPLFIIDDYVPALEERMDMALGFTTGYLGNLAIAMDRIGLEQRHRLLNNDGSPGQSTITCGTLIDSLAYNIDWFERMGEYNNRHPDRVMHRWRSDASIEMFSLLFDDTFNYDLLFWLPGGDEQGEDAQRIDDLRRNTRGLVAKFQEVERLQEIIKLEVDPYQALETAFGTIAEEFKQPANTNG